MFTFKHLQCALLAACALAWLASSSAATQDSKLPAGTSKANVDFVNKHQAELKKLEALGKSDECETEEEDSSEDQQ